MLIGQSAQAPAEELMAFGNQALALGSTSPYLQTKLAASSMLPIPL